MMPSLPHIFSLFPDAVICGLSMAAACGIIGVFVVLRRVVFISIALSETAACGIAAAMLLHIPPIAGAVTLTAAVVLLLSVNYENSRIPRDAVLGVVFLAASSLSILLVSKSGFGLHEIEAMLYGDLILAGGRDRDLLLSTALPAAIFFVCFIRPVTYTFLDRDAAQVMGLACRFWEIGFFILLGWVVSAASRIGGVFLVFCYLVVVPATALLLSRNLKKILFLSAFLGVLSTISGFVLSYEQDLPCNPTIIIICCLLFGVALIYSEIITKSANADKVDKP
jgi:zinc transport system permease protein